VEDAYHENLKRLLAIKEREKSFTLYTKSGVFGIYDKNPIPMWLRIPTTPSMPQHRTGKLGMALNDEGSSPA
jgi:hypothetical protein